MRKYLKLILLLLMTLVINCENSENNLPFEGEGTWVEIATKSDTIEFIQFGSYPAFELRRGVEMRSGYWLPKYGAGIYNYELKDDSIALKYSLSSLFSFTNYYFRKTSIYSFEIGNFYNQTISPNVFITFSKIE